MSATGLNPAHLLKQVVRPALEPLPPQFKGVKAEQIVMMIGAHESMGFSQLKQIIGPAIGLWQMEPATFHWLRDEAFNQPGPKYHAIRLALAAPLIHGLQRWHPEDQLPIPDASALAWNLRLAAVYCRARLIPAKGSLPERDDIREMALYAKKNYNTVAGDARPADYERAYLRHIEPLDLWRGIP
jgi:hypothetical protein